MWIAGASRRASVFGVSCGHDTGGAVITRSLTLLSVLAVLASGCTGGASGSGLSPTSDREGVQVVVANYEIVAETSNRFIAGLITEDGRTVAYGTVQMRFAHDTGGQLVPTEPVLGRYLPVPGTDLGSEGADPQAILPSSARGVYEVEGVRFLEPGTYVVEVGAEVQGIGVVQGSTRFEVLADPRVPGVGEEAPRTQNHLLGEAGVPDVAIDSRAQNGPIPDPELHDTTIAEAIRRGTPALVVFSTPVYCVSRFCGPVTNVVQNLAADFEGDVSFIHVEVWRDFTNNVVNVAAADWLLRGDSLNEPWAFLIGEDGTILQRWDNLFTESELRAALTDLR
jgi:hypothetical protein